MPPTAYSKSKFRSSLVLRSGNLQEKGSGLLSFTADVYRRRPLIPLKSSRSYQRQSINSYAASVNFPDNQKTGDGGASAQNN